MGKASLTDTKDGEKLMAVHPLEWVFTGLEFNAAGCTGVMSSAAAVSSAFLDGNKYEGTPGLISACLDVPARIS